MRMPRTGSIWSPSTTSAHFEEDSLAAKRFPQASLLHPVGFGHEGPQAAFGDPAESPHDRGEKQDRLLNVGRQQCQVGDLGDPGAGDTDKPRQGGVAGDVARSKQLFEPNRQGHQPRGTGNRSPRLVRPATLLPEHLLTARRLEVDAAVNRDVLLHEVSF